MTQDQVMGIVRQLLQGVGAILTTLGYTALATSLANRMTVIMALIGPIFQIVGLLWNIKANSKNSIIQSASAMPEVQGITLNNATLATAAKIADPTTNVQVQP